MFLKGINLLLNGFAKRYSLSLFLERELLFSKAPVDKGAATSSKLTPGQNAETHNEKLALPFKRGTSWKVHGR